MISVPTRTTEYVLSVAIDVLSWEDALARIQRWAGKRESRHVCLSNVHAVVTAQEDMEFSRIMQDSDMCAPDGSPVAWMLRALGHREQGRISGPDLMLRYCERASAGNESIYLLGSTEDVLRKLQHALRRQFPGLKIAGAHSPPFRELTEAEDRALVDMVNASGAGTVWISLGCPKQEKWIAAHRGRINAVMIGVGAAFAYHAGTLRRAPIWMQGYGLEWLHRLGSEPRRLWKRYLVTNSRFVWAATWQLAIRRAKLSSAGIRAADLARVERANDKAAVGGSSMFERRSTFQDGVSNVNDDVLVETLKVPAVSSAAMD
jgi:N-acetylglucosaminyldiphosphoundecaprenol N-acetyl-beta-D-mannosaminyltransferase